MKTNERINTLIKEAHRKVSEKTGDPESWYSTFYPQVPDGFSCGKGIAVYGRALNGDLGGKTLADLVEDNRSQFVRMTALLGKTILGENWAGRTIYDNIAKITWYDSENPSRTMFNAQYDEIRDCFAIVQEEYRPYITLLFTGNTACPSEDDKIEWNEPVWEYLDGKGTEFLDSIVWHKDDAHEFTISLFRCDGRYFLELDRPEHGHNEEHVNGIMEILRRNGVL